MYLHGFILIITVALVVWTNDASMYVLFLFPFGFASPLNYYSFSFRPSSLLKFSFLFFRLMHAIGSLGQHECMYCHSNKPL